MFDLPYGQGYWERRDKPDWEDISTISTSLQRKNPITYPDERPTDGSSQL